MNPKPFHSEDGQAKLQEIVGSTAELVTAAWVGEWGGEAYDQAYEFFLEDHYDVAFPGVLDSFLPEAFEQAMKDKEMLKLRAKAMLDGKHVWNGDDPV